jgi:hypothetical protein
MTSLPSTRSRPTLGCGSAIFLLAAAGIVAAGCEGRAAESVSASQAAVAQAAVIEFTLWTPPEAPQLGEYVANATIQAAPVNQAEVARLRAYLDRAAALEKEWRAAGKEEQEITRLRAELKTDMLREGRRP